MMTTARLHDRGPERLGSGGIQRPSEPTWGARMLNHSRGQSPRSRHFRYRRTAKIIGLSLGMCLLTAQVAQATNGNSQSQKKAPCTAKMVSSHEGDEDNADGDTVASQKAAFKEGATLADSDLWVTKDGYIIQMHANDVHDSTDGTGLVTEMTLAQILSLRTRHFHDPIPTLDDSLAIPAAHEPGRYLMF